MKNQVKKNKMKIGFTALSVLTAFAIQQVSSTEDIVIQIFSRRFINIVSDKYVSVSIDPKDMIKIVNGSRLVKE